MTNIAEFEGKTKEEALETALAQLGVSEDQIDVQIIESGAAGIFGIGSKPVKIQVTLKKNPLEEGRKFIEKTLEQIKIDGTIEALEEDNVIEFRLILNDDDASLIIGKRGQTLDSLQFLTNLVVNKTAETDKIKVLINVGDFRERREEALLRLADQTAEKVLRNRRKVSLQPMPANERRIIHTHLSERENIETYSEGTGRRRQIIVVYNPEKSAQPSN